MITVRQIDAWLSAREFERLEFKEAKARFDLDKLCQYYCALMNERGGHLVLGVSDKLPRIVLGSNAFRDGGIESAKRTLRQHFGGRPQIHEISHPQGRVVVVEVPSRPIGGTVDYKGLRYERSGESLIPMTDDSYRRILSENEPDFSATVCEKAHLEDLSEEHVGVFRGLLRQKNSRTNLVRPDPAEGACLLYVAESKYKKDERKSTSLP